MLKRLMSMAMLIMCGMTAIAQSVNDTPLNNAPADTCSQQVATTAVARQSSPASPNDDDWVNDSLLNVFDNIKLKDVEVTAQRQLIKQEVKIKLLFCEVFGSHVASNRQKQNN